MKAGGFGEGIEVLGGKVYRIDEKVVQNVQTALDCLAQTAPGGKWQETREKQRQVKAVSTQAESKPVGSVAAKEYSFLY